MSQTVKIKKGGPEGVLTSEGRARPEEMDRIFKGDMDLAAYQKYIFGIKYQAVLMAEAV